MCTCQTKQWDTCQTCTRTKTTTVTTDLDNQAASWIFKWSKKEEREKKERQKRRRNTYTDNIFCLFTLLSFCYFHLIMYFPSFSSFLSHSWHRFWSWILILSGFCFVLFGFPSLFTQMHWLTDWLLDWLTCSSHPPRSLHPSFLPQCIHLLFFFPLPSFLPHILSFCLRFSSIDFFSKIFNSSSQQQRIKLRNFQTAWYIFQAVVFQQGDANQVSNETNQPSQSPQ